MYLFANFVNNNIYYVGNNSGANTGGGSVNPNTPQYTGIFAQDYPPAAADLSQVINDEATGQTYDSNQRSLLSTDIISNDNDIAANQAAISANTAAIAALQTSAPNSHYHDVPAHTHTLGNHTHSLNPVNQYQTGLNSTTGNSGSTIANSVQQTSGPAGSTAVGHTHGPSDIPHTHTDSVGSHTHYVGSTGTVSSGVNNNAGYGANTTPVNTTTSGAQ